MQRVAISERLDLAAHHPEDPTHLDPTNWDAFRQEAHLILDDMIGHLQTIRDRPVWQPPTEVVRAKFDAPLPIGAEDLSAVLDDVRSDIVPYATGNTHPLFMGWVHGAGTPVGMVAEMISAGLNMNCGGRNHIGLDVERQITRWMSAVAGYPEGASGLFVTGSSMANFMAVIVAKTEAIGTGSRAAGLRGCDVDLVAYTSTEAHGCIAQAMELSGIGAANLRKIDVDRAGRMNPVALECAIETDRAAGRLPFLVVGTAGTVNTGAIDPLSEIAIIAARQKLWFHVDGAIGALALFSGDLRPLFSGVEASSSIALDFHKWGHVPYDAGFLLVRDGEAHRRAFAQEAGYLQRTERGLAAGETWPCDLGPDLSRGFRALKTWMTLRVFGMEKIGRSIAHTCQLARHLERDLRRCDIFELRAPVALNIVCFGIRGMDDAQLKDLVLDLHESGVAAPSWTIIEGRLAIRCAIVNHRTTLDDIDLFVGTLMHHIATSGLPDRARRSRSQAMATGPAAFTKL